MQSLNPSGSESSTCPAKFQLLLASECFSLFALPSYVGKNILFYKGAKKVESELYHFVVRQETVARFSFNCQEHSN